MKRRYADIPWPNTRILVGLVVSCGALTGSWRPAVAQEADEYVLARVETYADDLQNTKFHDNYEWRRNEDGSVTASTKPFESEEMSFRVWPNEGRGAYRFTSSGQLHSTGQFTWKAPPKRWRKGETVELGGTLEVERHAPVTGLSTAGMVMTYYYPAGALEAVGEARPPNKNPLRRGSPNRLTAYTTERKAEKASAEGFINARIRSFGDGCSITLLPMGKRGTGIGVTYVYELVSSSSEPPPKPPASAATGLYLEAAKRIVRQGSRVSIPIYLRYRGDQDPPPMVGNMNFEVRFDAQVANVLPHPYPASKPDWTEERTEPGLPRGNLLASSTLVAGNPDQSGAVLVGFAGSQDIRPGTGRSGETVTEIYFQAIGNPGDQTPLSLNITTCMDQQGHEVAVATIPGEIQIFKPAPPTPPSSTPPEGTEPGATPPSPEETPPERPGEQWRALDAYIALLMSIKRRDVDATYDVDRDGDVTSTDSAVILRESTRVPVQ